MQEMAKQQETKRDELIANKRALGSLGASLDQDVERALEKAAELREAIERLNERYVSACQRREAIISAGGEDPGRLVSPFARVGAIELPMLREYPPRKRMKSSTGLSPGMPRSSAFKSRSPRSTK